MGAHCASQQALVSSLEAQRARVGSGYACPRNDSAATTLQGTALGRQQSAASSNRLYGQGWISALQSLLEKLRKGGVSVHGMLADLVLLRRQRDEAAVTAVLGPALRNTIIVQTRSDGARVVAAVRSAGIRGSVRCNVLDEMREQEGKAACGGGEHDDHGEHPIPKDSGIGVELCVREVA